MNPPVPIPPSDPAVTRREFFRRSVRAGAAIAATGALAALLWDRHPPGTLGRRAQSASLPDFSIRDVGGKMAIISGADRVRTLGRALDALGGIGRFIKRGDRVVLKVNAAFAAPAILSATTHPDVAAELVRLCRAAGAVSVVVTDNPINDPESCFALSGIGAAVSAAGGTVALPHAGDFTACTLPGGRLIRNWPVMLEPFRGATKLIGVAPVKHHARAGASMTIKNWYGLLGGRRNQFHQDINGIIVELAQLVRPTLRRARRHDQHDDQRPDGGVPCRPQADAHARRRHGPHRSRCVWRDPSRKDPPRSSVSLVRAAALGMRHGDFRRAAAARDTVS
jgi:hypothetical protein